MERENMSLEVIPNVIKKLNKQVLKVYDPQLAEVIFTSPICNAYTYNFQNEVWDKMDCQGSLFFVSREDSEEFPYSLIVLNRLKNENFSLGVTPRKTSEMLNREPMEVRLDDSFIMIQKSPTEVYGLWLFEQDDRNRCMWLIDWCLENGSSS